MPVVLGAPETAAAQAMIAIARSLTSRSRGLAGRKLAVTPVSNSGH